MSSGPDLRERAIRALAVIGDDPSARAAFERAYSGPGDGAAVLATFTETTADDSTRATLRAVAFGRIDSPDDETRASQARQKLDELDAAESTRAVALAEALTAFEADREHTARSAPLPTDPAASEDASAPAVTAAAPGPAPSRRRARPVLLAVASFAAGLALASAIAVATTITMNSGDEPGSTAAPRTTALREDPSGVERGLIARAHASATGSVDAAESVFARAATARDRVAGFMPIDVVPDSARRLFGAGSTIVYAARNTGDEYCLLVLRGDLTTSRCTDAAGFARSGLYTGGASEDGASDPSFAVRWDGSIVEILSAG